MRRAGGWGAVRSCGCREVGAVRGVGGLGGAGGLRHLGVRAARRGVATWARPRRVDGDRRAGGGAPGGAATKKTHRARVRLWRGSFPFRGGEKDPELSVFTEAWVFFVAQIEGSPNAASL